MDILFESTIRATLLTVAVALLLAAHRLRTPRIAHRAWVGVALILLLLPAIVMWGPEAAVPLPRDPGGWGGVAWLEHARGEDVSRVPAAAPASPTAPASVDWNRVALLVYATGTLLLLLRLAVGVRHARMLVREATVVGGRLASPRCSTPVTVGLLAPVVILPVDWTEWPEDEVAAVLAHEEEHARARDPLAIVVTLAARALFWFHPFAWWLARRVAMLAEQACDAAVLARGHDVDTYATALLRFARAQTGAGGRVTLPGTAMPGAGLQQRLRMLDHLPAGRPRLSRLLAIAAAYAASAIVCVAATPSGAPDAAALLRESPSPEPAAEFLDAPAQTSRIGWTVAAIEHFDIYYRAAQAGRVRDLAYEAEHAYGELSTGLKYDLAGRIALVLVDRDGDIADGRMSDVGVRRTAAGAAALSVIVISTESIDAVPGVMLHELTHSFALQIVPEAARTAPWLIEGLAEHQRGVWKAESVRGVRAAIGSAWIPHVEALASTDHYWSHALFDFIADTYGDEGIRRCLFALRSRPQLVEAIPAAFGTPMDAFNQAFRAYVTARFGER